MPKHVQHYGQRENFDYNIIYNSRNYGQFKIIEEAGFNQSSGNRLVKIKFLTTGYENVVLYKSVIKGTVKDPYYPKIYGVACIGNASCYDEGYNMWSNILKRCYYENSQRYNSYGALGIKMDNRWLCFENFRDDLPLLPGYNLWKQYPSIYQLDKDFLQQGIPDNMKIYSVNTCCFMHRNDNSLLGNGNKNKYYGVFKESDTTYAARIVFNGVDHILGTYPTAEMAAQKYNIARKYLYNDTKIYNDVPYIDQMELMKYNKRHNPLYELF